MAIAIKDNTTALEALKTKAQSLPNKSDDNSGGTTTNGYDTSNANASPSDVLSPRIFYNAEGEQTGTMANRGSLNQTITSNGTQSYDAGYYSGGTITVSVPTGSGNTNTVPVATPTININTSGQITATVNQSAGITSGGIQKATAWLSDDYDADFVSSNIKSGVTIFGVQGTYTGVSTDFTRVTATEPDVREGKIFYDSDGVLVYGGMGEAEIDFKAIFVEDDGRALVYAEVPEDGFVEAATYRIGELPALDDSKYTLDITREGTYGIATEAKYLAKNIVVSVDAGDDFKPGNIVKGKTILGVTGTFTGSSLYTTATEPFRTDSLTIQFESKEDMEAALAGTIVIRYKGKDFGSLNMRGALYDCVIEGGAGNPALARIRTPGYDRRVSLDTRYSDDATRGELAIYRDDSAYKLVLRCVVGEFYTGPSGDLVTESVPLDFYGAYDVYVI